MIWHLTGERILKISYDLSKGGIRKVTGGIFEVDSDAKAERTQIISTVSVMPKEEGGTMRMGV